MHCDFQYFVWLCLFLSHIDSQRLNCGWNQYMCWAISCLWSHSSTHTQRVGRCPTEWRLGWYGEGALCWESNGIKVSPPTTCNQSCGRASSLPHNYNQPYSVSGLSSLFLIIDYHSTLCTQPQQNVRKAAGRKMDVDWQSEGDEWKCRADSRELPAEMGGKGK